jgi:probable FeS assembly SUF system protein SufT
MHEHTEFTLSRDTEAIQIPSGEKMTLVAGTQGVVTQTLGGSYTIATPHGLSRIAEKDLDALGLEKPASSNGAPGKTASGGPVDEKAVWEQLKQCFDPEIPVNIVDLGLIYSVQFAAAPDDKQDVTVDLTLTSQGCPEHVNISAQVKSRLEQLPGVRTAAVNVVWTPPWTPERLSPDAKKQLGIE